MRDPSIGFTKDEYSAAVEQLIEYSRIDPGEPDFAKLFDGEAAEWEQPVMLAFLLYGRRDRKAARLVDRFIAARGRVLPAGIVAALRALQNARASLYEIEAVHVGSGLDVRDVVSGEKFHVREVSATADLKKWDVIFAWVMTVDDHVELTGASFIVPRVYVEHVRGALLTELAMEQERHPTIQARELVGAVAWVALIALRTAIRETPTPQIRTMDGEELLFCRAHYGINDRAASLARLAEAPDLERDPNGFAWVERPRNSRNSRRRTPPRVLGHIAIRANDLVLETMSKDRNDRGKGMLEGLLGPLISHRADSFEGVEAAIESRRERADAGSHDLPADVDREAIGEYLQDYYSRWLDERIPALGNKTPRAAARTKRGRVQVEALLKEIENGTVAQPGGDSVDFVALRRELGIVTSNDAKPPTGYDANVAPDPKAWLAQRESSRAAAVAAYHRELAEHPKTPELHLHTSMHVIVENQLALGNPPEVRTTVDRLMTDGLTRHEAIHAVASVVAEVLVQVANDGVAFDPVAVARSLARLRPNQWRFR